MGRSVKDAKAPSRKKNPAVFSDPIIEALAKILLGEKIKSVFDPMAGSGKITKVREYGFRGKLACNDIEKGWDRYDAQLGVTWSHVDAAHLKNKRAGSVECVATSPSYGNRMADSHEAKDDSRRISYTHNLGRPLKEGNTGAMQWGERYREKHVAIWQEMYRILRPGGLLIVNVSDHIRNGEVQKVSAWHVKALREIGFTLSSSKKVKTRRCKFGANRERVEHENIFVFRKVFIKVK